ncbi:MAG: hypothetical protein EOO38_12425, partial [Cytophagaceae bacterium]
MNLTVLSGNNQAQPRLSQLNGGPATATFAPISVLVKDASGNTMPGQQVTFTPSGKGMNVQMDPMGISPCIVISGDDGVAILNKMNGNSMCISSADGPFTISLTCDDAVASISGMVP